MKLPSLLLLSASLLFTVDSCMPGYEAERDRLREHLGIEWIPHGLDHTGLLDGKNIRHDFDLNCNFTHPEECRWKNAGESEGMDSRDFHLFEKQDYTEWPALQVHPGPSKIDVGDRMILVGDRTREEQHALIYSASIPCQVAPGNLTFTYWAYNNARIEVVLLETVKPKDGKGKAYRKFLHENPYVDCGTVPMNTNCHAEIPARETPFHIGFRAYDISNTQGSFIIIDDILYSAPLCRVSIDLAKNFESKPMVTSAHGELIHKSSDLMCVHFDLSCRWRSGGKLNPMWRRSVVGLSDDFVMQVTGTKIAPKGAYAVLYIEQDTPAPYDILRSDSIECQAATGNTFTYRFWATKDVILEACTLSVDSDSLIECHRASSGVSPAPLQVTFSKTTKRFYIAIRVVSLNSNVDNAIVIDDLSYQATLCHEAVSALDLGPNFITTPILSVLLGRHVGSAKELWCDFSKRASDCSWGHAPSEIEDGDGEIPVDWAIGNGPLDNEKFYSLTGQTLMPNQEFAVARFEQAGSALLLSEVVLCVSKSATLSFHLWTTGVATLRICLVEENSSSLLDCQPVAEGPVRVELPRVERPFKIALRADSEGRGMAIIDHLQVNGDICGVPKQYSAKSFNPGALIRPDANVCRLLSCSFNRGHPCLYDNSQLENSAQFEVTNGVLVATLNSTRPIAILESTPFQLNTVSRLHFVYSVFGDVALFVCNDSAGKELENCFRVEGTGGDDYVELLPSDTKVYLLGRLIKAKSEGTVQIKRLTLTDPEDEQVC
ncbi:hypothetical protein PMAYCL1PPCAC_18474 [Pristionchus mayeri]|uniref:MAM domain-containing protein n=1 Tax=Pristionchus mayeri TaxID=1317129 RepID=A0AAN5CPZ0_9BILA|nr:hypothetical protein PMAYCL1PPCAC_18474 [Pristionchus mayeri]